MWRETLQRDKDNYLHKRQSKRGEMDTATSASRVTRWGDRALFEPRGTFLDGVEPNDLGKFVAILRRKWLQRFWISSGWEIQNHSNGQNNSISGLKQQLQNRR